MDDYLRKQGPVVNGVSRVITHISNLIIGSYTGIPSYYLNSKNNGYSATAELNVLTCLTITMKNWSKPVADADFRLKRVTLLERTRYDVVKCLDRVINWFDTGVYPDLFFTDETDHLKFNFEHQKLNEKVFVPTRKFNSAIMFTPAVVEIGTGLEGVNMYLNTRDVMTQLTISELQTLFKVLADFNFQAETLLNLYGFSNGVHSVKR